MRESSHNLSKQNSQQPKDIQGGDKKVMKKSLSTILSLAMAFSMFSTVALAADATKTSADFSDLKDLDAATKAKFDALISAGIFDGVKEGTFGLKDEMNRAQFAKVAALIFNLKVDTTAKTSSFSDVKSDDPANGYALPYIEAVKAAGITDGYAPGQFNPAGKVTKEQLAAFLVRGLGKDSDAKATPGVSDTTVSDWAKGYVALALNLKLLSNGTDGKFGGNSNATRDLLVLSSSEAKAQYKPVFNGKYSIASFKATDANILTLQLNGALDDAATKALKIEVKRDGNVATNYTTTWSADKTTATLTFDTKFQNNTYGVTISGVSNLDATNSTSSVTTTVERIAKIEFLTAADTLPRTTDDLRIDFKATNQYGAKSSLTYNNFTINSGSDVAIKGISGEQAFYLTQATKSGTGIGNVPAESTFTRNDRISVTIIHEDSGATANKVFAVGDAPNVAKIEVGDLLNSSNVKLDSIESQKDVYLGFKAYDQYGIPVQKQQALIDGVTVVANEGNVDKVAADPRSGATGSVWFTSNEIGDDAADLKFRYTKNEEKTITLTLIANGSGQSVTKTVKVTAPKTPSTVEFGSYSYTLAEGDQLAGTTDSDLRKKFYVPIIVKDAKGNALTAQEIADKAYKFTIYSTGSVSLSNAYTSTDENNNSRTTPIVQTGEYKGMIEVASANSKGSAGITVQLLDSPTIKATWSTSVAEKRKADKIAFSLASKKYQINGTDNELKFKIYDQNGGELKNDTRYRVQLNLKANTDISTNTDATVASVNGQDVRYYGLALKSNDVANSSGTAAERSTKKVALEPTSVTKEVYADLPVTDVFDKSFKFYTTAYNPSIVDGATNTTTPSVKNVVGGTTFTLTAKLIDVSGTTNKEISSVSTTLEVLKTSDDKNKLTYEVYLDKGVNNTILAADDYLGGVAGATYVYTTANYQKVAKEIKVRATNSSGELVAVPSKIVNVASSNPLVANVPSGVLNKLVGLDVGTAKVNVQFTNGKNETQAASLDVTTKNEAPIVQSIVVKKSGTNGAVANATLTGKYVWDALLAEKVTVKDQFGDEFVSDRAPGTPKDDSGTATTDQFIQTHQALLNLSYYASDVKSTGPANTITISSTGQITAIGANVTSFTLNILAPSGVTSSVSVVVTP
jgi:hypothetical protein